MLEIAHYKLNDNAENTDVDDSANAHEGTATSNTSSLTTEGIINSAFAFAGTDYVSLANPSSFPTASAISIAMWVNVGLVDGSPFSFSNDGETNTHLAFFPHNNGESDNWFIMHWGEADWDTGQGFAVDEWHHVVFTYDGTTEKFYYDGSLVASREYSLGFANTTVKIGSWNDSLTEYYFTGSVDDVRVYDFDLNQDQIDFIYNSGTGTESPLEETNTTNFFQMF